MYQGNNYIRFSRSLPKDTFDAPFKAFAGRLHQNRGPTDHQGLPTSNRLLNSLNQANESVHAAVRDRVIRFIRLAGLCDVTQTMPW